MVKFLNTAILLFFLLYLGACVPSNRLYYFNDKFPGKDTLNSMNQNAQQRIQRHDRLTITVSSTDPALTAYLNPFNVNANQANMGNTGYLVNDSGNIEFPLLNTLKVEGKSTIEAAALIKEKLSYFYKDLFVSVNLRGQVYVITGRVGTPVPMLNERLTIFEAISQSGAQDPFDKKNEVWLVRDSIGIRNYVKLDLNSKNIFQSPNYYLQNNDLIYVQPGKWSSFLSPTSPARNALSISAVIISILLAIRTL